MGEFNHWSSKTHTCPWSSLFLSLFNLLFIFFYISTWKYYFYLLWQVILVSYTALSTTYCYFFHLMACHKNKNHHTSSLLLGSIVFPFNTTFKMPGNCNHSSVFSFTTPPPWDPLHFSLDISPSRLRRRGFSVLYNTFNFCSTYIRSYLFPIYPEPNPHAFYREKKPFLKWPNSDYSKHKTKILVYVHVFNRRYIFGRKITSKHFPV